MIAIANNDSLFGFVCGADIYYLYLKIVNTQTTDRSQAFVSVCGNIVCPREVRGLLFLCACVYECVYVTNPDIICGNRHLARTVHSKSHKNYCESLHGVLLSRDA